MNTINNCKIKFRVTCYTVIALFLTLSCEFKNVGPKSLDDIETMKIANELSNSETKEKTAIAIEQMFDKIGIGNPVSKSRYEKFILSEDQISDLANLQQKYINKNTSINEVSIKLIFNKIKHSDDSWLPQQIELYSIIEELQRQITSAYSDINKPENSLVIFMTSKSGDKNNIPLLDENTTLNPIQIYLFIIWLVKETKYNSELAKMTKTTAMSCEDACYATFAVCMTICLLEPTPLCELGCLAYLGICLASCHDQGGGN